MQATTDEELAALIDQASAAVDKYAKRRFQPLPQESAAVPSYQEKPVGAEGPPASEGTPLSTQEH